MQREKRGLPTDIRLPQWTDGWIQTVRQEMLDRGFTLLDTSSLFGESLPWPLKRKTTVLPSHGKQWWKFPKLACYASWLEELLAQALPEESVGLTALEVRDEAAGSEDKEVDRLHVDGSYIRSVCTLHGLPTIYREGKDERSVLWGQTLLMPAIDRGRATRVRCTLHRRPGIGPERLVIVCSFEPQEDSGKQGKVYHQIARRQKPLPR